MNDDELYELVKEIQTEGLLWPQALKKVKMIFELKNLGPFTKKHKEIFNKAFLSKPKLRFPVLLNPGADKPKPHPKSIANFRELLINHMEMKFRYNELKATVYINGQPIDDPKRAEINNIVRDHGLSDSRDVVSDMLLAIANEDKYHPFKEAIEATPWDGQDHMTALFEQLNIQADRKQHTPVYKEFLFRWLRATVRRCYEPGFQNLMLVFLGAQGAGKSRFFSRFGIAPGIYNEGGINPESKDDVLKHLSYNIFNIEELDGITRRKDVGAIKRYITQKEVGARPAYGYHEKTGRSQLSFVASVNTEDFLQDASGNRRFLVIPLEGLNAEHKVNMQQVFAQAKTLMNNDELCYFNKDEIKVIEELNSFYTLQDRVQIITDHVESGDDFMDLYQIVNIVMGDWASKKELDRSELSKLGAILSKKGIEKKRDPKSGRIGYYVKAKPYKLELKVNLLLGKNLKDVNDDEEVVSERH